MTTAPGQQPAEAAQPPTVIINNNSSASAASAVGGFGRRGRRRHSFWVHFWLFFLTAGIGNVFYAMHMSRWNRDHGF